MAWGKLNHTQSSRQVMAKRWHLRSSLPRTRRSSLSGRTGRGMPLCLRV